jgi:hypothetical protein
MPTVTQLTSNGAFQSSGGFDEVSLNSGSIQFNRASAADYFNVAKTNIGNLTGNPFTIETWVYLTQYGYLSNGGYIGAIFSSHATSGVGSNNGFEFNLGGTVSSWTGMNLYANNGALAQTYSYSFSLNTWYHVAVNRTSGGVFTVYVNGNSIGTTTNATGWTDYTPYGIAHSNLITYRYYLPGYISNYRIVVGSSIYNNNFIPSTSPLTAIANTKLLLLTNSQNPFEDSSGNNNTIIKNGNPIFNTLGPFYLPGNTSINLANTNNNPILGSNTNIVTSTTSNGVVMISNEFDEVSKSLRSLYFSGSPNYLSVPNTNIGNLTGNPFTIEAWVYLTAYPTLTNFYASEIFSTTNTDSGGGGNFGLQFALGGTASSYTGVFIYANNGALNTTFNYSFSLRTWYHIALTRTSGGVFTAYVDGKSIGTTTNATGWTDNSPYAIGRNNQSGYGYYFPGNISNFRLNIGTPLYSANFTPTMALSSVANTKLLLNNFAEAPFGDSSGNNNTITINGSVTSNTLNPFDNAQQKVLNIGTMMVKEFDELTINPSQIPPIAGYLAWYEASSWTGSQWTDKSGNGNHVTTISGTITSTTNAIGNGSTKAITTLQGNISANMTFPVGILPPTYTLFHVARYTGGSRQRIFNATDQNWLSGFWSGTTGVAYHNGWLTGQTDIHGNNWMYCCDQNSLIRSNGVTRGTTGAGSPSFARLAINTGLFAENSDWQVAEVIVYSSTLSATDYQTVEAYLANKYGI